MERARSSLVLAISAALTLAHGCASTPEPAPPGSIETSRVSMPPAREWSIAAEGAANGTWFFDERARHVALVGDPTAPSAPRVYAFRAFQHTEGDPSGAWKGAAGGAIYSIGAGCVASLVVIGTGPLAPALWVMFCAGGIVVAPLAGLVGAAVGYDAEIIKGTRLEPVTVPRLEPLVELLTSTLRAQPPGPATMAALEAKASVRSDHTVAPARVERNTRGGIYVDGPFDGALVVSIDSLGLMTRKPREQLLASGDPEVRLWLRANVTSYSVSDGWLVHHMDGAVTYIGASHRISELTADDGDLLAQQLDLAYARVSDRVAGVEGTTPD